MGGFDRKMYWRKSWAMFGIHGDFTDPNEISSCLGLVPTHAFGKGEEFLGHTSRTTTAIRKRLKELWSLYSALSDGGETFEKDVEALVVLLEPKADVISKLRTERGFTTGLYLHYDVPEGTPGYCLTNELLLRICKTCERVSFEFYFFDPTENENHVAESS